MSKKTAADDTFSIPISVTGLSSLQAAALHDKNEDQNKHALKDIDAIAT